MESEPAEGLPIELREDWSRLARASRNVFSTWEWASTWWRHFGGGRHLEVSPIRRDGGRIAAILPLYRRRLPSGELLRFVGHGPADQLGPVCGAEEGRQAIAALRSILDGQRSAVLVADRVPEWLANGIGGHTVSVAPSPVLTFETHDWNEYLATRASSFRQTLRRKERRLTDEGGVFRLADAPSLERDLDTLFRLHRERWEPARTGFLDREAFHRAFAATALERGWLRLWILEVRGAPAAAWLGFRFACVESYVQAGRSRGFDSLSPGLLLLAHTVREAQADDMDEYRFLRGAEAFKGWFTDVAPHVQTVVATRGAVMAAGWLAFLALRRLPLGLSRWLR